MTTSAPHTAPLTKEHGIRTTYDLDHYATNLRAVWGKIVRFYRLDRVLSDKVVLSILTNFCRLARQFIVPTIPRLLLHSPRQALPINYGTSD